MEIKEIMENMNNVREKALTSESPIELSNFVIELQGYLHYVGQLLAEAVQKADKKHASRKVNYSRLFIEYKTGKKKEDGIEKVTDGIAEELATKMISLDYTEEAEANGLAEQYKNVREDILELMNACKKKADIVLNMNNRGL